MPSLHDELTGLMNRSALHEIIEKEFEKSTKEFTSFGLILFDIDRFKLINYGFGDGHGDIVLQQVAKTAKKKLRPGDWIGRWGGQQFLCVLPDTDCHKTDLIAEELRHLIENLSICIESQLIHITASFGVACFPEDGSLIRRLVAAAEAGLYHAKEYGRNRLVHVSRMQQQIFGMGTLLDAALHNKRIIPAYQPIVDLQTGETVAEEALARMVTPEGKILEAEEFIEVARQLQLTYKIDHAIMTSTFGRCVSQILNHSSRTQFVNISGNLLRHPQVVEQLLLSAQQHCRSCGFSEEVKPLVIEITERELLDDIGAAREMLKPFLDFGLRLALDDFGSGYSSFEYLADLPFSFLKIEGKLIKRAQDPRVRTIVQGIQDTAAALGVMTLAEGVENSEIAKIIKDIGIDWAQGYFYDRPIMP